MGLYLVVPVMSRSMVFRQPQQYPRVSPLPSLGSVLKKHLTARDNEKASGADTERVSAQTVTASL